MGERRLTSRLLLDTHILIRVLFEPRQLSKEQKRSLDRAIAQGEMMNISAATLIEVASVFGHGGGRFSMSADAFFGVLETSQSFKVIPIDLQIGRETAELGGSLRDLWDRAIVATARVHGLRLVTSDQAIIDSNLVSVVE